MVSVDEVLDTLADRVADRVLERLEAAQETSAEPSDRLLSLDEFVALLPAKKKPETWKRWMYTRLSRGEVPGAVKLGGSWFFRPGETLASLGLGEREG